MSETETLTLATQKPTTRRNKRFYCIVAVAIFIAIVIFFVGFLSGYFVKAHETDPSPHERKESNAGYKQYHERMIASLKAGSVEQFSQ